jgi:hypothetical protein
MVRNLEGIEEGDAVADGDRKDLEECGLGSYQNRRLVKVTTREETPPALPNPPDRFLRVSGSIRPIRDLGHPPELPFREGTGG